MDTTAQNTPGVPDAAQQDQPVQQPQQIQPATSVGSKEQEAIASKPMTEYASEQEPVLPIEVAEAGVEGKNERVRIPQEASQAGLEQAKESVPVPANPSQIRWPITPEKAQAILATPHLAVSKSVAWLATLVGKMVKKQKREESKETAA